MKFETNLPLFDKLFNRFAHSAKPTHRWADLGLKVGLPNADGQSWGHLGPILGPSGADLEPFWGLGPI